MSIHEHGDGHETDHDARSQAHPRSERRRHPSPPSPGPSPSRARPCASASAPRASPPLAYSVAHGQSRPTSPTTRAPTSTASPPAWRSHPRTRTASAARRSTSRAASSLASARAARPHAALTLLPAEATGNALPDLARRRPTAGDAATCAATCDRSVDCPTAPRHRRDARGVEKTLDVETPSL